MNERDLHDLAAAYAVDAVDDEEREAFAAHLPSCEPCRQEVAQLTDAAAALSDGLQVQPPPELRDRVLGLIAAEAAGPQTPSGAQTPSGERAHDGAAGGDVVPLTRARGHRRPGAGSRRGWLVAAAAAVVVGVGAWGVSQTLAPDPLDRVVSAADAREYESTETPGLSVITSASADQAVLRLPEDLTPPPSGSVLQAWFITGDGEARSAGVLDVEETEDRSVLLDGSFAGAAVVGLTVEPEGGSSQPTTDPIGVIPLG